MARTEITIDRLKEAAELLARAARRISDSAESARTAGLETVWIHWGSMQSVYLPKVCEWAAGIDRSIAIDIESHQIGKRPVGEVNATTYHHRRTGKKATKGKANPGETE